MQHDCNDNDVVVVMYIDEYYDHCYEIISEYDNDNSDDAYIFMM